MCMYSYLNVINQINLNVHEFIVYSLHSFYKYHHRILINYNHSNIKNVSTICNKQKILAYIKQYAADKYYLTLSY